MLHELTEKELNRISYLPEGSIGRFLNPVNLLDCYCNLKISYIFRWYVQERYQRHQLPVAPKLAQRCSTKQRSTLAKSNYTSPTFPEYIFSIASLIAFSTTTPFLRSSLLNVLFTIVTTMKHLRSLNVRIGAESYSNFWFTWLYVYVVIILLRSYAIFGFYFMIHSFFSLPCSVWKKWWYVDFFRYIASCWAKSEKYVD